MAVGFRNSSGVDFDSLFDPYLSGTSPAATGFRTSSSVDLAGRYAPIALGSKGPNVGFRLPSGVDLSNLWAAAGTATYGSLPVGSYTADDQAFSTVGNVRASLSLSLDPGGTWAVRASIAGAAETQIAAGTWQSGEAGSVFEVLFTVAHVGGNFTATVVNGAAAYQPLGTGRSVSLTVGPFPAANNVVRQSNDTIRVQVRRIATGVVTLDATANYSTITRGFG